MKERGLAFLTLRALNHLNGESLLLKKGEEEPVCDFMHGLGSGLAFCLLRPSNQSAHAGNRQPKLAGDRTHGHGAVRVRVVKGLFSILATLHPLGEGARLSTLDLGDVIIRAVARFGQRLHALDKGFVSQIDLLAQRAVPQARIRH